MQTSSSNVRSSLMTEAPLSSSSSKRLSSRTYYSYPREKHNKMTACPMARQRVSQLGNAGAVSHPLLSNDYYYKRREGAGTGI